MAKPVPDESIPVFFHLLIINERNYYVTNKSVYVIVKNEYRARHLIERTDYGMTPGNNNF
jgi:hypothetical protein